MYKSKKLNEKTFFKFWNERVYFKKLIIKKKKIIMSNLFSFYRIKYFIILIIREENKCSFYLIFFHCRIYAF